MKLPVIRWNTKIHLVQLTLASISMIQLLEGAYAMALISVIMVYMIGACENGGHISDETTE